MSVEKAELILSINTEIRGKVFVLIASLTTFELAPEDQTYDSLSSVHT